MVAKDGLDRRVEGCLGARPVEGRGDAVEDRGGLLAEEPLAPDGGPLFLMPLTNGFERRHPRLPILDATQDPEGLSGLDDSGLSSRCRLASSGEGVQHRGGLPCEPGVIGETVDGFGQNSSRLVGRVLSANGHPLGDGQPKPGIGLVEFG